MPPSAADATRFTATGPHANANQKSSNPILKYAGPAPPGETPQQKVIRLREAARRARQIEVSTFDKVVSVGRVWADRVHRGTVYFLLSATALSAVYTVFSISDMLIYNRRKRKEWTEQQESKLLTALENAHEARKLGTATPEQLGLLEIEETVDATERERRAKGGTFQRAKTYWYSMYSNNGPAEAESQDAQLTSNTTSEKSTGETGVLKAVKEATERNLPFPSDEHTSVLQATKSNHERLDLSARAGPFDRASAEIVDNARSYSSSWFSWIKGK